MFMVKKVGIKTMLTYFRRIQRNNIELLCHSITFFQSYIYSKMFKPVIAFVFIYSIVMCKTRKRQIITSARADLFTF